MNIYNTQPQIEIKTITPSEAAKILARNNNNRPIHKNHLDRLISSMKEGRFQLNGESIKLSKEGNLVDGQHRLTACVRSGVSFQSLVVTGIDDISFLTIDTGAKRTCSDALSRYGVTNYAAAAGCLRWIIAIENDKNTKTIALDPDQAVIEFEKRDSLPRSVTFGVSCRHLLTPTMGSAAHYLFSKKSQHEADRFFYDLSTGEFLSSSDPVFMLRNRLISMRIAKNKKTLISQPEIMSMVIRAWNARRQGRELKQLKGMVENSSGEHSIPKII